MRHEQLRENLSAYLDDELSGPEKTELEGHLRSCEGCRRELESLRAASAAFKARAKAKVPEGLREAALRRREPRPELVFAVAAALILFAFVAARMFKPQLSAVFNQVMGMISGAASTVGTAR
ncbi:MAG: zf-HC2 domain-containing protein [Elusimicrobiota bacterium]